MKFRNKVLIINILILSVALGFVGFFMIDKNFKLALDTQIENAIVKNNLLQSSVEYEILDIINSYSSLLFNKALSDAGEQVGRSRLYSDSSFYIRYNEKIIYASDDLDDRIPKKLFDSLNMGGKNYCIVQEDDGMYIYITSQTAIKDNTLNIISRTDITSPYTLMQTQTGYYRIWLLVIIGSCSVFIYIISAFLTRPLEQLNTMSDRFADGDYSVRADIRSGDEIELLSHKFNHMADSISAHIDELNDMVTRREQFVSDFTHEIKTPMTTIIGYADTLRSKELSRKHQIMAANFIFSEGKRLENMSFKLFDLIYLGKHEITKQPIGAEALLRGIGESTIPSLEAKSQTLKISCENAVIFGDRELLTSAFINLIDNAKKASDEGSEIILRGYRTEDAYVIEVKDYGRGMTPEVIKHICDEFYMADKSRSRKEGGAGLGLSLASVIFERHNATVRIDSIPDKGTVFAVEFPAAETDKE